MVLRLDDSAMVACDVLPYSGAGASQTHKRRSRTYSIANTPRIKKAHPK